MRIDKEKYTGFINDADAKQTVIKNISKLETVLESHIEKHTDFLDPYVQGLFISIINAFDELKYKLYGGTVQSERKVIQIYRHYLQEDELMDPLSYLQINYQSDDITHKDVLGSVLSLGIVREKIGDIYIKKNNAQIIVDNSVSGFIKLELKKIKNVNVDIKEIQKEDIIKPEQALEEKIIFVPSLRIDNIISSAYNISRAKASEIIKSKRVKINHEQISSSSQLVELKSLISTKKMGRIILLDDEISFTKKGNIKLNIGYYN